MAITLWATADIRSFSPPPSLSSIVYELQCSICSGQHSTGRCQLYRTPTLIFTCAPRFKQRLIRHLRDIDGGLPVRNTDKLNDFIAVQVPHQCARSVYRMLRAAPRLSDAYHTLMLITHVALNLEDVLRLPLENKALRLQVHPKSIMPQLLKVLPESIVLSPQRYTHVLQIAHAFNRYFIGLVDADDFRLAPPRLPKSVTMKSSDLEEQNANREAMTGESHTGMQTNISRAYHKLREIFEHDSELRNLNLNGLNALDIGSSPGGWTQYLLQHGCAHVVAIDSGTMLIDDPRMTHMKGRIEDCKEKLHDFAPFDIVTCDMNCHPLQAAATILNITQYLLPDCYLILTVKEPVPHRIRLFLRQVNATLSQCFTGLRHVHLLANGRERTLVCKRIAKLPERIDSLRTIG